MSKPGDVRYEEYFAPTEYSVLVLKHRSFGRAWEMKFNTRPERAVVISGDEPSADEIIETLLHCNTQYMLPAVLSILAAHLWREKK